VLLDIRCSFCGLANDQRQLVLGPTLAVGKRPVAICRECVALCDDIINEQNHPADPPPPDAA
jgi:ATP-dependent protease Clp ATPase subunit